MMRCAPPAWNMYNMYNMNISQVTSIDLLVNNIKAHK